MNAAVLQATPYVFAGAIDRVFEAIGLHATFQCKSWAKPRVDIWMDDGCLNVVVWRFQLEVFFKN